MNHASWSGVEQLEPRLLMSATGSADLDALGVSPIWFEDLQPQWRSSIHDGVFGVTGQPDGDDLFGSDAAVAVSTRHWIVQLNEDGIAGAGSVSAVDDLLNLDLLGGQVIRGLGLEGMVLIETDADVDGNQFLQTLSGYDTVEYVENDLIYQTQSYPSDAFFTSLWGLHNTGQNGGTADADIDALEAWQLVTGGPQVIVGVIDTGVDYTHNDLAQNIWTNPGEISGNGIDDDGNGFVDDIHGYDFVNNDGDPMDDHGHGTHVAGTIAGVGDNANGVTGVNWSSSVMALKFLSGSGSGSSSDAVRAVNYATMMRTQFGENVRVTNNSWGGGGRYAPLESAIQSSRQADMLFIAAAGNSGDNTDQTPHYPSTYNQANIISVAATDRNDELASFSNYGRNTVDLAAPGVSILSTVPNGGYANFSGTSMAAPHVAGVAALAWSAVPNADYAQIRDAIYAGVDQIAGLSGLVATDGRLNAYQTMLALGFDPVDPVDPLPDPGPTPPPAGDSYENDSTAATAAVINPNGTPQYHSIHVVSDVDWVRFTLNDTAAVVIETAGSSGDTRLWLYSDDDLNNEMEYDDDSGVGLFSRVARTGIDSLDAGTYYVKVDEFANNSTIGIYTITVTATSAPTGDAYETDDAPWQASTIATDGSAVTHSIHHPSDVDWVTFDLNFRSNVLIETVGSSGDSRMWLYGPGSWSTLIEYDDDDGVGLFSRIDRSGSNALNPGTYYLKIDEFGNNNTIASYTISVDARAAAPDLAVGTVDFRAGTYTLGLPIDLTVNLTNQGTANLAAGQSYSIEVHLSIDSVWGNGDDLIVATVAENGGLSAGADLDRSISSLVPSGVAEGDYSLAVFVDSGDSIFEASEANNLWWSAGPAVTLTSSLVLTFNGSSVARYTDANGVDVAVALRGPGHGEVHIEDGEPARIEVYNSTERSSLSISTQSKTNETTIGDIHVNGSLRGIDGRSTDLSGDLTVIGSLGKLTLDDTTGQGVISIGASSNPRAGTTMKFDRVVETRIDSASPIRSLSVTQWLDDDSTVDELTAPSLARLISRGDFGADLNLSDAAARQTLGRVQIHGRLYGADIHSAGDIRSITVGAMQDAGVYAGLGDGTSGLPASPGEFSVLATIRSLKVRGIRNSQQPTFINSNIAAASLGRIGLGNVQTDNAGGSFGLVADNIASYQRQDQDGAVRMRKLDAPGTADVNDDFEVRLL